jgi:hypothetical protein
MGNVVEYSPRGTVSNSSVGSGSGGGDVEDILRRLGNLETQVGSILTLIPHLATAKSVSEITALIPHLATKADVAAIPHLATKADLAEIRTDVAAIETKIIKWIIATVLSSSALMSALAFSIAKFVH